MATIFCQTFTCVQCRLLAPVRLSFPTDDGPLCLYCVEPLVAELEQQNIAQAWVDNLFADPVYDEQSSQTLSLEEAAHPACAEARHEPAQERRHCPG